MLLSLQVDVYSFGVIMWEVVSHEPPSRGRMRNLKVPQECPEEINALINACLSEDPTDRPSAKEVYDVLKEWRDKHAALLQGIRQERTSNEMILANRSSVNDTKDQSEADCKVRSGFSGSGREPLRRSDTAGLQSPDLTGDESGD